MGGSFNPVHIGHIMLADYLVQFGGLDEVWMMLSPLNPLKAAAAVARSIVSDGHRLAMLDIACSELHGVRPCDIELSMPRPSYSIDSLTRLAEKNPDCRVRLIIGSDNWKVFGRWRCANEIIERFSPIVYPRPGYEVTRYTLPTGVDLIDAPMFGISSTFVRDSIAGGHDMKLYLPRGVWQYIIDNGLYAAAATADR